MNAPWTVAELDVTRPGQAREIHRVMQVAYTEEARIIGVDLEDFPPLGRPVSYIRRNRARFCGIGDPLKGFVSLFDGMVEHLCVDPAGARQGIGSALMGHLMADSQRLKVETAAANAPAIGLYEKLGFRIVERVRSDEGIDLVCLQWSAAE